MNEKGIFFWTIIGMANSIISNLASNGYNITKYLPFLPVKYVMPYLIRRKCFSCWTNLV
ncbi:proline dehydrogenase family protein [Flavobacterium sp.]|uniref:proline dehydrogenase family protein n=1 Tax=Flavobacterium sp. TaxID=239 RepID=UPI0037C0369E